jgi:glycosyltransferase involved in cell wall biosynthesis
MHMRIVFASHTHPGGTFVVGSHHLAREMSALGHQVVHVSTPITPAHIAASHDRDVRLRYRLFRRPCVSGTGVLNIVPLALVPWSLSARLPLLRQHYAFISYHRLHRLATGHLGGPVDVLFIDQPKLVGLASLFDPKVAIYRPTDLYHLMHGNPSIARAEVQAIERARSIAATSEEVAAHVRRLSPTTPTCVIPNGFEPAQFLARARRPAEYTDSGRQRAVYVGAMDERFDFMAVQRLSEAFRQVDFMLIGPGSSAVQRLCTGQPNVHFLGPRPYSAVPSYLQHADIGLLPLSDHPSNAGRSPMKLYEYAAAGLPVITNYTAELARRREPFLYFYRGLADVSEVFASIPKSSGSASMPLDLAQHSWRSISEALLELARP